MAKIMSKLRNKRGFTLIELIVVLAVLAIIMAIAVPRFGGVRESAKVDSDMATLASIAKLAEFEFVRLNKELDVTSFGDDTVSKLIGSNFAETNIFQSENLKSMLADSVDVTFSDGKVTSIDVGEYTFEYLEGKFTPPEGFMSS